MITPQHAAQLFEAACRAELRALKPGNVHVHAAGHGMTIVQFDGAAAAAAGPVAAVGMGVGERIEHAVSASLSVAGCNTNLGIVLLSAPLLAAAEMAEPADLRARLGTVLDGLTIVDAEHAFRAIANANPGGLGNAEADVREPARLTLKAAMQLADHRDRVAHQYNNSFADVFAIGVAALQGRPVPLAAAAIEDVYLAFLSAFPDTHIARKFGLLTAEAVQVEARRLQEALVDATPDRRHARLLAFDATLKARGFNPGTSADLTVVSLLTYAIQCVEAGEPSPLP